MSSEGVLFVRTATRVPSGRVPVLTSPPWSTTFCGFRESKSLLACGIPPCLFCWNVPSFKTGLSGSGVLHATTSPTVAEDPVGPFGPLGPFGEGANTRRAAWSAKSVEAGVTEVCVIANRHAGPKTDSGTYAHRQPFRTALQNSRPQLRR